MNALCTRCRELPPVVETITVGERHMNLCNGCWGEMEDAGKLWAVDGCVTSMTYIPAPEERTLKLSPMSQAIADLATRNAWRFEDRYTGRCMDGARCPGIICAPWQSGSVRAAARRAGVRTRARQDSHGRDVIVYWPEA